MDGDRRNSNAHASESERNRAAWTIICPACAGQMSAALQVCPHCGHPVYQKASRAPFIKWLGFVGLFPVVTLYASPFAWVMGTTELRDIDAGRRPEGGRHDAELGRRLGKFSILFWGGVLILVSLGYLALLIYAYR